MTRRFPHPTRRPYARGGFSLVEALFASALILVMMLFVLPLFIRAMVQNVSGRESSIATTHGKWTLEEANGLPLDREVLSAAGFTLPDGDPGRETCATWDPEEEEWVDYDCSQDVPAGRSWARDTTLRVYSLSDLYYDGTRILDNPLPGDTPPEFVHLREVAVAIEGQRSGPLGPAREMDLVTLKGF